MNGKYQPYYRCLGKSKIHAPVERCCNKGWKADKLEAMVWGVLADYLGNRDLIIAK